MRRGVLIFLFALLAVSAVRISNRAEPADEERFAETEGPESAPPSPVPAPPSPTPTAASLPVEAHTVPSMKPAIIAKPVDAIIQLPPLPLQHPLEDAPTETPSAENDVQMYEDDNDPEAKKLNVAMEAVREDMLATSHQLNKEMKWINEVNKIISEYEEKVKRVQEHIHELRGNIKQLYHKKQQLKNLRLQHQLELKQKEAQDELNTLMSSIKNVHKKDTELGKSKADLQATITSITEQLDKLKTTQRAERQKEKEADVEEQNGKDKGVPEPVKL